MMLKAEKLQLKKLLSDAIPLLCKNGLPLHSMFRVEAMIGITVDDSEVTLICFKETVTSDGELLPQVYGLDDDVEETEELERFGQAEPGNHSTGSGDQPSETVSKVRTFRSDDDGSYRVGGRSAEAFAFSADRIKSERDDSPQEMDAEGYQDSGRLPGSGSYLYEGNAEEGGGYNSRALSVSRNRKSHAVGSEQFLVKEEVDLDVDECMFVKEEQGLDPGASYSGSFEYGHSSNSTPGKSRARKGPHMFQDFSHESQAAMQQSIPLQKKSRNSGPIRGRKQGGNGLSPAKAARLGTQMATTDIRSRVSTGAGGYSTVIQGLCDSILQQSTQNGEQYVCHICEAKLSNATTLRNHIRGTHLALKTERCNICGESFKWAMQLARHKKREHGDGSFIHIYNSGGGSGGTAVAGQDEY